MPIYTYGQGDAIPAVILRARHTDRYHLDTVAGRPMLLVFLGSLALPQARRLVEILRQRRDLFDGSRAALLAVSADARDLDDAALPDAPPGFRLLLDQGAAAARRFGLVEEGPKPRLACFGYLLDEGLRVLALEPIDDPDRVARAMLERIERLAPLPPPQAMTMWAPALRVPGLFEPDLCRRLIALYDATGGEDSGFMVSDALGRTHGKVDYGHKRRRDCLIQDEDLKTILRGRINRRLVPAIEKFFQFKVTRLERYIVACYDAGEGGYFRPHRDNTTKGTAHRKFAVTINLNADDYDGGDLRFPEFGRATYRAPTGGAVVFSCSMLHEATPVTRGRRYCFLPFLYDEAGDHLRLQNLQYFADESMREKLTAALTGAG